MAQSAHNICFDRVIRKFIFMPQTLEKLRGHIALGLSMRLFVRASV